MGKKSDMSSDRRCSGRRGGERRTAELQGRRSWRHRSHPSTYSSRCLCACVTAVKRGRLPSPPSPLLEMQEAYLRPSAAQPAPWRPLRRSPSPAASVLEAPAGRVRHSSCSDATMFACSDLGPHIEPHAPATPRFSVSDSGSRSLFCGPCPPSFPAEGPISDAAGWVLACQGLKGQRRSTRLYQMNGVETMPATCPINGARGGHQGPQRIR
jgi:hypothetical protein